MRGSNPAFDVRHPTAMHRTQEQLDAALDLIRASPRDHGTLEWIVCRPTVDERTVLEAGALDLGSGLVGDSWNVRGSRSADGWPEPARQLTVMNARSVAAIAGERDQWALAGDQLYVDLDLGVENLPPGSRLQIRDAVIEVTAPPHLGCAKFTARFGSDATRWVNSAEGRELNLRGINARVIVPGDIRRGDRIRKLG
jgi:hypothetical protein